MKSLSNAISNSLYLALANIIMALSQWGLLFVLVRTGGVAAVGAFSLVLAVVTPVFLFFQLGGRQAYVTDTHNHTPYRLYRQLRWQAVAVAVPVSVIAGVALGTPFLLMLLWALIKVMESLSDMENAVNHRFRNAKPVAISSVLRSLGGMGLFAVTMALGFSVEAASLVLLIIYAAVWWMYDRTTRARLQADAAPQWTKPALKTTLTLAQTLLPLGLMAGLTMLQVSLPRLVVNHMLGTSALGEFALMAYFISAGSVIVLAIMQAILPNLAELLHSGKTRLFVLMLAAICGSIAAGGLAVWVITLFYGEALITLLYGAQNAYLAAYWAPTLLACAFWFMGIVLSYGIQATRAFHRLTLPQAVYTVAMLATALLCTHLYGLTGAFYGLTLGCALRLCCDAALLAHILHGHKKAA